MELIAQSQGSVLGSLLFNTDMIDLLRTDYECKYNVASDANDTTPYSCATDITSVTLELQLN